MEQITMDITKAPINDEFRERLRQKYNYMLTGDFEMHKIISAVLWACGYYLSSLEDKKTNTNGIYYIKDVDRLFACILEYDANEENEENPCAFDFT